MTFNSFKMAALCCLLILGCRAKKNTIATSKKKHIPSEKLIVEKKRRVVK